MRWLPPQPVAPWTGVRACDKFGAIAVQASQPGITGHAGDHDCLSLNMESTGHRTLAGHRVDAGWRLYAWRHFGRALYDGSAMASAGSCLYLSTTASV
ncbi:MAG: carboxylesterase family protein [Betaproteobacteria bacterium]|nr:carboxylesterase family protein [Betaproteobacteria bacterium]